MHTGTRQERASSVRVLIASRSCPNTSAFCARLPFWKEIYWEFRSKTYFPESCVSQMIFEMERSVFNRGVKISYAFSGEETHQCKFQSPSQRLRWHRLLGIAALYPWKPIQRPRSRDVIEDLPSRFAVANNVLGGEQRSFDESDTSFRIICNF